MFHPLIRLLAAKPHLLAHHAGAYINLASLQAADLHPERWSLMTDFSPSEFSRFRLQYNRDEALVGDTDDQVILQYIMSLGPHGAHRF